MRRKVVILLAVPLLFLLSIIFLMSDIKNLSTQNDEFLTPPVSTENVQRVVGKPFSKSDQFADSKRERDPLTPEESNTSPSERTNNGRVNSRAPTRPAVEKRPHPQEIEKRPDSEIHPAIDIEKRPLDSENRPPINVEKRPPGLLPNLDRRPPVLPQPPGDKNLHADQQLHKDETVNEEEKLVEEMLKERKEQRGHGAQEERNEPQKLEELQQQPKQSQTIGGFGKQAPDGVQSINEPKKVVGDKTMAGSLSSAELNKRKEAVKAAYLHSWKSYEKFAWGHDELKPLSHSHQDWLSMGLSIVDSIDTMYLMGLTEEYEKARNWIASSLRFDANKDVSFFETTIRVVGGLVSMFDLTNDEMYLSKAEQLAKKLMPAFNTPTGIPYTTINLQSGHAINPQWAAGASILSEAGTVQIEYATLSKRTGTEEYGRKALKVYDQLDLMEKPNGLYPVYINPHSGSFSRHQVTLGALGDSFYEYLLKVYLLSDKKEPKYQRMYEAATDAIISKLVKTSTPSGLTYIAEWENGHISDKMDHLVCFAGAMFALGAYHNVTTKGEEHMRLGKEITRTCHEFYKRQATGLGPELVRFNSGEDFHPGANHYILRPETVESYYVLYWITGDPIYQEWGWEAFNAIEQYCRTPDGYAGVRDVTNTNVIHDDLQQSFFMAETLKYLYLLFAPRSTLSLDDFVFNTEAHPIKIWK